MAVDAAQSSRWWRREVMQQIYGSPEGCWDQHGLNISVTMSYNYELYTVITEAKMTLILRIGMRCFCKISRAHNEERILIFTLLLYDKIKEGNYG